MISALLLGHIFGLFVASGLLVAYLQFAKQRRRKRYLAMCEGSAEIWRKAAVYMTAEYERMQAKPNGGAV